MKVFIAVSLALTTSLLAQTPAPTVSSGKHPFTFEDMMKLKRVGAPVPSPDGKWVRVRLRRCRSGGEHENLASMDRAGERRRIAPAQPNSKP